MKSTIKRIKENITEAEYKKLIYGVQGHDTLKEHTKVNLVRAFTLLYFTGLRLNEVQNLTLGNIKELLDLGQTKLILSKTSSERKLYAGKEFQKYLKRLFDLKGNLDTGVITKGSTKEGLHPISFIAQVNAVMKSILGEGYTSHSFRQGLITEMGSKGVNVKIISQFIGHSDVKTTMRYIKPTDDDVRGAMVR
ncbi:site-specific integrase [Sulfurospirillum sp. 'SP']|nr:site-specific integrase [Sulfurospirillum sp. 'SP']WNZ00182.1 site-specific integrase [Sulfurospirillum sp. 'SP']WNZ00208.1 site-specific integrase [Sulfurospirillum sp. 'SP']